MANTRKMTPEEYWKNFQLGREMDVAAGFIYDGLRQFHNMQGFADESEVFQFLYYIAVGFERLAKVCIVLTEHSDEANQAKFEDSLKTHDHRKLITRVMKHHSLKISDAQNDLIDLLAKFYKAYRYDRFSLSSAMSSQNEKKVLRCHLTRHFDIDLPEDTWILDTPNDKNIRQKMAEDITNLAKQFYKIIKAETSRLGIFTHELESTSKTGKVFLGENAGFVEEDRFAAELIVFLMNAPTEGAQMRFLRDIKPLGFDPAIIGEYIASLGSYLQRREGCDEVEELYADLYNPCQRKEMMDYIASPHFAHYEDEEDETKEGNLEVHDFEKAKNKKDEQ